MPKPAHLRLVLVSTSFPPFVSGVGDHVDQLADQLSQLGHQVTVLTSKHPPNPSVPSHFPYSVIRLPSIPNPWRKRYAVGIPLPPFFKTTLDQIKPDLIHIHDISPLALAAAGYASRHHLPLVATHHFMTGFITHSLKPIPLVGHPVFAQTIDHTTWKALPQIYKHVHHIITPTQTVKKALQKYHVTNPISVISNGVDLNLHQPKHSRFLYQQFHIASSKNIAFYAGRLDPDKRLDILISAWLKLKPDLVESWQLVLAGEGLHSSQLKHQIHSNTSITFTGLLSQTDLVKAYQSSTLFIMPSPIESQSRTTLFACAHGLPVIATNMGALPELVKHHQNGWLYDFNQSPQSLTKTLTFALNAPPSRLVKYSQTSRRVAQKHDLKLLGKQVQAVYNSLI